MRKSRRDGGVKSLLAFFHRLCLSCYLIDYGEFIDLVWYQLTKYPIPITNLGDIVLEIFSDDRWILYSFNMKNCSKCHFVLTIKINAANWRFRNAKFFLLEISHEELSFVIVSFYFLPIRSCFWHFLDFYPQVTGEELNRLVQGFDNVDTLTSGGVTLAGNRYIYLSGTDKVIRAKLGKVGVHCVKTQQGKRELWICICELFHTLQVLPGK